ncbi:CinA family protein [Epilithonimonas sp. UC225_85]|uniref:CinA family protein n=1 Tax=Epilithonimonas sp. UC225_85 TaxID=3350167 RepID=UPI0036D3CCE9
MEFPKVLLDKISHYLIDRSETISIAESVTSGFLQLAFSEMPDAEKFFNGGMTAYTANEKIKHLDIHPEEAEAENCVSKNITETMVLNAAKIFDTDWAIATTGYATPVPESGGEIFAHFAISYQGDIILSDRIDLHPLTNPLAAKHYFMEFILGCLRCEVKRNFPALAMKG